MSCAACVSRVTGAVSRLPEVSRAEANLLTGILKVEASENITPDAVISAVKAAGYQAVPADSGTSMLPDHAPFPKILDIA